MTTDTYTQALRSAKSHGFNFRARSVVKTGDNAIVTSVLKASHDTEVLVKDVMVIPITGRPTRPAVFIKTDTPVELGMMTAAELNSTLSRMGV